MAGKKNFCEIHQSKPRIDGVEKVSGKAVYAGDMYMENMLYVSDKSYTLRRRLCGNGGGKE